MSRLYSSPEVIAVQLVAIHSPIRFGTRHQARRIAMPSKFASISPAIAFNKHAFPCRRRSPPTDQIIRPAKTSPTNTSPVLFRKSSSAITGFRSLGGREQHSPGYCAQLDLRFGTFHSAGSRFENSGLHPLLPTGPATLDRCCGRNVVAPGEYSKGFFCVPKGLYRAILWPATALGMPARSALGAITGINPAAVINAWIWAL